ncbi:MAG: hypothetical protein NC489_37640 [Ruminococcus flavefaciens]|nr:hypothetical protein [Ruminococcus flavefaciens]
MKFLIFGTGRAARKYMRAWYNGYYEHGNNSILAFIDNDASKIGTEFLYKPVVSPSDISKYDYDYIVICSTFIDEIKQQLINEIGCQAEYILSTSDMKDIIYNYFNEKLELRSKKIVYIGYPEVRKKLMDNHFNMQLYFEKKPMCVDFNDIFRVDMSEIDYVFISDVYGLESFYIERQPITSEKNLIAYLAEKLGISSDKILTEKVWSFLHYNYSDCLVSWGEENQDKIFYVIRLLPLHSIVQMARAAITLSDYARKKGYIPVVDGLTHTTTLHEEDEVGKVNIWEKFFEQPDAYNMKDIRHSKNVILSCRPYVSCDSRQEYKKIVMKPELKEILDRFAGGLKEYKKILGVHYRGTDYNNGRIRLHSIQPTVEQMISVVKEKMYEWNLMDGEDFDGIFLCTESKDAVPMFYDAFGDMLIVQDLERWPSDIQYAAIYAAENFKSKYDWAAGYWVDILALSQCDSLISCLCVGQREAEKYNNACYQNEKPYAHIHHVSNGIHGVDD